MRYCVNWKLETGRLQAQDAGANIDLHLPDREELADASGP
jgi:hypothetical protein